MDIDIQEFLTVFCSFGKIPFESHLKDTNRRIDRLIGFCNSITEGEIAKYVYEEGNKSVETIELLKRSIWNSCQNIIRYRDTIISHYIEDAFGTIETIPIVDDDDDDIEITGESTVYDPLFLSDNSFVSIIIPKGTFDIPGPDDYTEEQVRLGEVDTSGLGLEVPKGTPITVNIKLVPFREELYRISKTGQVFLDVINAYLINEKDRPKSSVESICTSISPILTEFKLFTKDIDGYGLMRMLSPEDGNESDMQPSTMIKNETLALHLLKLLEMDGPEYFRQNNWFERIAQEWGVEKHIHNRLYDFHQNNYSQKAYKRIKRLCDVVKEEMQIESLKYEEAFLIR